MVLDARAGAGNRAARGGDGRRLCGAPDRVESLGRWLAAQAAALHSPRELAIAAAIAPERLEGWDWLKWLPHTRRGRPPARDAARRGPGGGAAPAGRDARARPRPARRGRGDVRRGPARDAGAPARPRRGAGARAGARGRDPRRRRRRSRGRDLARERPARPPGRVRRDRRARARDRAPRFTDAAAGTTAADVSADGLAPTSRASSPLAGAAARCGSRRPGGGHPAAGRPGGAARTGGARRRLGRGALVGDGNRGRSAVSARARKGPVTVDLRADGPHALVAGTTGAGKSELLQTLIASLASRTRPTGSRSSSSTTRAAPRSRSASRSPTRSAGHRPRRPPRAARPALAQRRAAPPRAPAARRGRARTSLELERRDPAPRRRAS